MAKTKVLKKKKATEVKQSDSLPKTTVFDELKMVSWANPRQLFWLLIYVIILCIVLSAIMMGLDNFFGQIRDAIIK